MNKEQILKTPSIPTMSPAFPAGPYKFINREFFIILYESDPELIREFLPEPLVPDPANIVAFEFINMPDSSGFGSYSESGCVIPCTFEGKPCNYIAQMFLDDEAPVAAGREIWGFPKKYAHPKLAIAKDTLTGTLDYAGQRVAMGTMGYKLPRELFAKLK
jgi:acetoacetate decarboxylase